MKRFYLIIAVAFAFVLAYGCSESPLETDNAFTEQLVEFNAIEADFSALTIEDTSDSSQTISSQRVERLGRYLRHLNRILERLRRFEQKYPNEEARKLIRRATRIFKAAVQAYNNHEYRKTYRLVREARKTVHDAMMLLKPNRGSRNTGGG